MKRRFAFLRTPLLLTFLLGECNLKNEPQYSDPASLVAPELTHPEEDIVLTCLKIQR